MWTAVIQIVFLTFVVCDSYIKCRDFLIKKYAVKTS